MLWLGSKVSPPRRQERLTAAVPFQNRTSTPGLGGAPDLFHTLFDLLSGVVGHFERHVSYPTAALQGDFHGLTRQVALYGCKVLRSSAGAQLNHVVHVLLNLMPNHLEVLLRHSTHHSGGSSTIVKHCLRVGADRLGLRR